MRQPRSSSAARRGRTDGHDHHLGIVSARPPPEDRNVVLVLPMTEARMVSSFAEPLDFAIQDNANKLSEAVDLEHHLAVLIDRFDASTDPTVTPVPSFPPELDFLWVVHRYRHQAPWLTTWVARSGAPRWTVHPAEAESAAESAWRTAA